MHPRLWQGDVVLCLRDTATTGMEEEEEEQRFSEDTVPRVHSTAGSSDNCFPPKLHRGGDTNPLA